MAVEDFSTTAASNTTLGSIALGENAMSVNDINNAFRELMKQLADWRDGAIAGLGDSGDYQPLDATLTALAGVTVAADDLVIADGADSFTALATTSYGQSLLALANADALKTSLGTVAITASSLSKPGYVKFDIGGTDLTIQWGSGTIGSNTTGTISFPTPFTSSAVCVVSGGSSTTSREGDVHTTASTGLTSQSIVNTQAGGTVTYNWIAIGI